MVAIPLLVIVGIILIVRRDRWKRREMVRATRRRHTISNSRSRKAGLSDDILNTIATFDVDELRCYSCNDIFDLTEEVCNNCGASRPKCVICYQDIRIEEKGDLIQLPCCNVYVHEKHIITWLKQNKKCPNCRKNLMKWFGIIDS